MFGRPGITSTIGGVITRLVMSGQEDEERDEPGVLYPPMLPLVTVVAVGVPMIFGASAALQQLTAKCKAKMAKCSGLMKLAMVFLSCLIKAVHIPVGLAAALLALLIAVFLYSVVVRVAVLMVATWATFPSIWALPLILTLFIVVFPSPAALVLALLVRLVLLILKLFLGLMVLILGLFMGLMGLILGLMGLVLALFLGLVGLIRALFLGLLGRGPTQ